MTDVSRAELDVLLGIARRAGELVAAVYARDFAVEYKGPDDPVTEADRVANAAICAELRAGFPGVPVVAEESPGDDFLGYRTAERVFFVDPVDGTREFVARNGEFVVMIGLLAGARPVAGVVLAPTSGAAWLGAPGLGAWAVSRGGSWAEVRCSAEPSLARARLVITRSHFAVPTERVVAALGVHSLRPLGSAGLKGVAVAAGEAEAWVTPFGGGHRWDTCAPEAIVAAAGGRCSDARGEPIDYRATTLRNEAGVLMAAPALHGPLCQRLQELGLTRGAPARGEGETLV